MAADLVGENLLNLFDDNWFLQNIAFPRNPVQETPEKSQPTPPILSLNSSDSLVRSFSDGSLSAGSDLFSSKGNVSPISVLPGTSSAFQTIVSGKELKELEEKNEVVKQGGENRDMIGAKRRSRRERKEGKGRKSFSELESEELKGFMDLGFVFSEEHVDSSLASVIPGLRRLKKQGNSDGDNSYNNEGEEEYYKSRVSRPYLSEAWELLGKSKVQMNPLANWSTSRDTVSDETEMKNQLRLWAHTVASIVRRQLAFHQYEVA